MERIAVLYSGIIGDYKRCLDNLQKRFLKQHDFRVFMLVENWNSIRLPYPDQHLIGMSRVVVHMPNEKEVNDFLEGKLSMFLTISDIPNYEKLRKEYEEEYSKNVGIAIDKARLLHNNYIYDPRCDGVFQESFLIHLCAVKFEEYLVKNPNEKFDLVIRWRERHMLDQDLSLNVWRSYKDKIYIYCFNNIYFGGCAAMIDVMKNFVKEYAKFPVPIICRRTGNGGIEDVNYSPENQFEWFVRTKDYDIYSGQRPAINDYNQDKRSILRLLTATRHNDGYIEPIFYELSDDEKQRYFKYYLYNMEYYFIHHEGKNTLDKYYNQVSTESGDIVEHIPLLTHYAQKCSHIIECGVKMCVSTWAFVKGLNKSLLPYDKEFIMVDLVHYQNMETVKKVCNYLGIKCTIMIGNDLDVKLPETDLLFIDTWGVYPQLKAELTKLAPLSRKYIIMHDTTVYRDIGERIYPEVSAHSFNIEDTKIGLWKAVEEFLTTNSSWKLKAEYKNCNGLTILKRVPQIINKNYNGIL